VGPGGSREATYALKASLPAGTYHLVLDGFVLGSVDVTFELIRRRGTTDTSLVTWMAHYDAGADVSRAQAFDYDEPAAAIDFAPGDLFVFRYSAANTTTPNAYVPNGDGPLAGGRLPSIALPK
jgi:hypothetical protein